MDYSPIKLSSVIKDYLWGGKRLITDYGKKTTLNKVAESWELSTHPAGESIIATGKFAGTTMTEYIKLNGTECIGSRASAFGFFPIIIKLIDAKDNLSIQVHPDDEYALRIEGEYGKTEMWYIVDCEPGAYIYYGFNKPITKKEFRRRIENNTLIEILKKVPVAKGDVFFIPAGTIHAICSGILICEVQQNSNTTYRVYDYNRRDKEGKIRELHVDKAIEVSNLYPIDAEKQCKGNTLVSCKYFTVEKISCTDTLELKMDCNSFRALIVLDGCGELKMHKEMLNICKGDSIFIPAQDSKIVLNGRMKIIMSYV